MTGNKAFFVLAIVNGFLKVEQSNGSNNNFVLAELHKKNA